MSARVYPSPLDVAVVGDHGQYVGSWVVTGDPETPQVHRGGKSERPSKEVWSGRTTGGVGSVEGRWVWEVLRDVTETGRVTRPLPFLLGLLVCR